MMSKEPARGADYVAELDIAVYTAGRYKSTSRPLYITTGEHCYDVVTKRVYEYVGELSMGLGETIYLWEMAS